MVWGFSSPVTVGPPWSCNTLGLLFFAARWLSPPHTSIPHTEISKIMERERDLLRRIPPFSLIIWEICHQKLAPSPSSATHRSSPWSFSWNQRAKPKGGLEKNVCGIWAFVVRHGFYQNYMNGKGRRWLVGRSSVEDALGNTILQSLLWVKSDIWHYSYCTGHAKFSRGAQKLPTHPCPRVLGIQYWQYLTPPYFIGPLFCISNEHLTVLIRRCPWHCMSTHSCDSHTCSVR